MKVSDIKERTSIQITVGTKAKGSVDHSTKSEIEEVRNVIKNNFPKRFNGKLSGEVIQSGRGQFGIIITFDKRIDVVQAVNHLKTKFKSKYLLNVRKVNV